MFTPEMMESVKKVEATRAARLGVEPRRMTADEKDALLKEFHPDYREEAFAEINTMLWDCKVLRNVCQLCGL